jgi:2-oxo-4-hydroxy-4-carboxy--5-ureidoimidazoline (OHCU) decarboxylase
VLSTDDLRIGDIDGSTAEACAVALAPLFEGAPGFLARLCAARPFGDASTLFATARAVARSMPEVDQLQLIDAHPRLGASPATMSALSVVEQGFERDAAARAGLDAVGPAAGDAEAERRRITLELQGLNSAYEARFGFRYCVFVAGRPHAALLPGFEAALSADRASEVARALHAVVDIAQDRWAKLAGTSAAAGPDSIG